MRGVIARRHNDEDGPGDSYKQTSGTLAIESFAPCKKYLNVEDAAPTREKPLAGSWFYQSDMSVRDSAVCRHRSRDEQHFSPLRA